MVCGWFSKVSSMLLIRSYECHHCVDIILYASVVVEQVQGLSVTAPWTGLFVCICAYTGTACLLLLPFFLTFHFLQVPNKHTAAASGAVIRLIAVLLQKLRLCWLTDKCIWLVCRNIPANHISTVEAASVQSEPVSTLPPKNDFSEHLN